jgi:hypothetical protein
MVWIEIMLNTRNLQTQMRVVIRMLKNPLITTNHETREYLLAILEDLSLKIFELETVLKKLELVYGGVNA